MAFYSDPNALNSALANQGSTYRVPAQQPAVQPAPAPQPAQQPQQPQFNNSVSGAHSPDDGHNHSRDGKEPAKAPEPPKKQIDYAGAFNSATNMMNEGEKKDGMAKLGGLIGTVLSVYTGNAAGAANGMNQMKENK